MKPSSFPGRRVRSSRHRRLLAAAALCALGAAAPADALRAVTYTWTGGGSDGNWSTAADWLNGTAPVSSIDTALVFGGSAQLASYQNGSGPFSLNSLTFNSDAGAFTLGGGQLVFSANSGGVLPTLTQNSTALETIGNTLNLASTLTVNGPGSLLFNGAVFGGGGLTMAGAGTLTLAGVCTYAGPTTVNNGTLAIGGGSSVLGGGTLTVDYTQGQAGVVASVNLGGTGLLSTGAAYVGYNGKGTFNQTGGTSTTNGNPLYLGYNSTATGTYNLSGGTLTVGSVIDGAGPVSGSKPNPNAPGSAYFYFNGGLLVASQSDSPDNVSNPTSFFDARINASVRVGGAFVDTSGNNVTLASDLLHDATRYAPATDGGLTKLGAGTLTLKGTNTYTGTTTVSTGTLQIGSGGTAGSLGGGSVVDNAALVFNRSDNVSVANAISGTGSLTQAGVGTLILGGNNTYTGQTLINAGILQVGASDLGSGKANASGSLGGGSVLDNAVLVFNRPDNVSVANAISGTGSLTQAGTGTLTLAGTNTFTGGVTVSAGRLAVGSGGSLGASDITVGAGAAFQITGTGTLPATGSNSNLTVDGTSANPATANLDGSGTLYRGSVSVGNSGVGTLTQTSGTLSVNSGGSFNVGNSPGSVGTYTLSGGGLSTGFADVGYSGNGTFNQSGGSFSTNGHTFYLGYNPGSVGTYTLSGTGNLSTNIAFVGFYGNGTVNQSGGSFSTNGNLFYLGFYRGSVDTYNLSGGMLTTNLTQVSNNANTSTFTQTGGTHTTGTLRLTGFSTSSRGTYTLAGGVLNVGTVTAGAGGASGTSVFHFAGGTLQASANNASFFQDLTTADVQGGGALIDTNGFNVTMAQNLTSGASGNTPDGGLTKKGPGTLTLTATNTYTGKTTVNAGTLCALSPAALPDYADSGDIVVNAGAILAVRFGGTGEWTAPQIDALRGGATFSGGFLGLDTSDASGPITYGSSVGGSLGLAKLGAGTLTLTGTNTYTGGTNVLAGTLVASNNASALAPGAVSISGGATLALNNTSTTTYSQAGATTFTGAGTLQKTGTGTITLGGSGTVTLALAAGGLIDVQGGTLVGSSSYQADYTNNQASLNIASGTTFNGVEGDVRVDALTGAGTLLGGYNAGGTPQGSVTVGVAGGGGTFSGVIADNSAQGGVLNLTKTGAGTEILTGANTYTGGTVFAGGVLNAGSAGALGSTGTLSFTGGTLQFSAANTTDYSARFSQAASQAYSLDTNGQNVTLATGLTSSGGSLAKLGAGTLTLTGTNTYTGKTTVSAGTLQIGSGGTAGSLGSGSVVDNAVLVFNRPDNVSVANAISGTGSLTQAGTGTLTLAGTNTFTGGVTVSAGRLAVGSGGSLGASDITVGAGAAFQVTGTGTLPATNANGTGSSSNLTVDGTSANPATANLDGSGTLYRGSVSVGNSGVGTLTQTSGTLSVNSGGSFNVGYHTGSVGTYTLSGTGSLSTAYAFVGSSGSGTFNQSGGSFTTNGHTLYLGYNPGSVGTYTLSGTGSLSTNIAFVGYDGSGTVNQSGGSFSTNGHILYLGYNTGSGTYTLSDGMLTTGYTQVSDSTNTSSFTQTGGTHTTGTLGLTGYSTSSQGTYTLAGGTLNVGTVTVGDGGASGTSVFHFAGGTLQASASNASFFQGLTTADVQAGGAKVDTQGYNVTVAQSLIHDTTSGAPSTDGGLTKLGTGTLILSATNTYTGNTTVSAGTLTISNNNGSAPGRLGNTNNVTLNPGGTLLLGGSASNNDRINNAASMTILGGSTVATGGLSEGAAPTSAGGAGGAVGIGALTLMLTTTPFSPPVPVVMDFGSATAGNGSALVFSSLTADSKGAYVNVLNWTGSAGIDSGAAGNDRLLFATDPGFTIGNLKNWQFSNDAGVPFATGGMEIAYNGEYEIVPVPEPATWVAGVLVVGAAALTRRHRRARRI